MSSGLPEGWHAASHALWQTGQRQRALQAQLVALNAHTQKPTPLVLQWAYYLCLMGDWATAARCLQWQHQQDPANDEVLYNLAVALARSQQPAAALHHGQHYARRHPHDAGAWDLICAAAQASAQWSLARDAGTRALNLKNEAAVLSSGVSLSDAVGSAPSAACVDVVAFSLWGTQATYLRGAVDNMVAAAHVYPNWQVRIYLDDSVPPAWQALLRELGADLRVQPSGQSPRQKLCWRFQVANDPNVRRFLVRDIDSVVNARERAAVDAWIESGKTFHVMRDWWTHTDLMLAGMWGGMAGVLPSIEQLLADYCPSTMETPNVDQWFLRDRVWPLLRHDCCVHDRCFRMAGSQPWPLPDPAGHEHVGRDEHAANPQAQQARIAPYLARLKVLSEAAVMA